MELSECNCTKPELRSPTSYTRKEKIANKMSRKRKNDKSNNDKSNNVNTSSNSFSKPLSIVSAENAAKLIQNAEINKLKEIIEKGRLSDINKIFGI